MHLKAEITRLQYRIAELEMVELDKREAGDAEMAGIDVEIEKREDCMKVDNGDFVEQADDAEIEKVDDAKINNPLIENKSIETDNGIGSISKNDVERQPSKLKLKLTISRAAEVEADVQRPKCEKTKEKMQTYRRKGQETKRKPIVEEGKEGKQYYTRATSPTKEQGDKKKAVAAAKKRKKTNIIEVVEVESNNGKEVETFPKLRNIIESRHYQDFDIEEQKGKVVTFFSFAHKFSNAYKDDNFVITGKMVEDLMFGNFTDSEVIDFYSNWLKKNPFNENIKCIFVSSLAWTHLKANQTR